MTTAKARDEYLTVPQYLERVPLSQSHIYTLLREGKIPSIKIGKRILIPKEALEAFSEEYGLFLDWAKEKEGQSGGEG